MSLLKVIVLAIVQGLAELLPVSSSAHVVVTEKLLGLDPSSPPMTLLLVMLHTGTMLAVIAYFWPKWRDTYFRSGGAFRAFAVQVVIATFFTALIGEAIVKIIEKTLWRNVPHAEIEDLFSHLEFIAPALAAAGLLIVIAGIFERRRPAAAVAAAHDLNAQRAGVIGAVQGLCLPFRGFSRSGATISTGLLLGIGRRRMEEFSFALAVVLTPPVIARELLRLVGAHSEVTPPFHVIQLVLPGLLGMVCSFCAGLLALSLLSRWLETGRWKFFGYYCLAAAAAVFALSKAGF